MFQRNSLRGRIALTTTLAILAVAGILLVFSEGRASLQNKRFTLDQLASSKELLSTVISLDSAILKRVASELARMPDVDAALNGADTGAVARITELVDAAAIATSASISIDIITPEGKLLSRIGEDWTNGLDESEIVLAGIAASGLRRTSSDQIRLFVSEPVRRGTQVTGHVVASLDLVERTGRLFRSAWAIGINLPGADPTLTRPLDGIATQLADQCCEGASQSRTIRVDGMTINLFALELLDPNGERLGDFVSLRDITASAQQRLFIGLTAASAVIVAILLGLGTLMWVLRTSFRPLGAVVRLLQQMAEGSTSMTLKPLNSTDEIQALVATVERARAGQQARDRLLKLDSQLAAARNVQQALVPSDFDLSPKLEIFGAMKAAEEVGGDFFDLFNLADGRLCMVIADVSGKGIGPALFAARASMMLRAKASNQSDLVEIITATNYELCKGNREDLFITVFIAAIDAETGECECVNCGHCQPFIIGYDGPALHLTAPSNIVLGAFDGYPFQKASFTLHNCQTLLGYSDGFDEAQNPIGALLGNPEATRIVTTYRDCAPDIMVDAIMNDITVFSDGANQADDITLVALRRRGAIVREASVA
jgi:sigma-B regulation protein RsbU (phosphoserine phosphatase)